MTQLIASGEIRSVKIGHLRRIPASALKDYVDLLAAECEADHG
jgi:excisionase family DNA binding protein